MENDEIKNMWIFVCSLFQMLNISILHVLVTDLMFTRSLMGRFRLKHFMRISLNIDNMHKAFWSQTTITKRVLMIPILHILLSFVHQRWNELRQANLCLRAFRHDKSLTAHAQPFRGARDLVFCLKVPLDSLLVWASSGGSGKTARMRRLAWSFAARISDKYQIRLTRSKYFLQWFKFLPYSNIYTHQQLS